MLIRCPACGHSGQIDDKKIPTGKLKAKCPKCALNFVLAGKTESVKPDVAGGFIDSLEARAAKKAAQPPPPITPPPNINSGADKPQNDGKKFALNFHGTGGALFGIFLGNALLSAITLNIYYFWGKVKVRKYLYGQMELLGERFNHLGTGKELFKGAFKAGGIFLVVFVVPNLLTEFVHPAFKILLFVGIFLLRPFVLVAARRYRYSRTEWHGVRFSFRGTIKEGMKLYIASAFMTVITLGYLAPRYYIMKQAFWRSNTFYGTAAFKYNGDVRDVLGQMIKGYILIFVTFGFYWFWYKANLMRYDWGHTSIQSVRFGSDITGGQLLAYHFTNLLLLVLTLGIGYPWYVKRKTEFWAKYVYLTGGFDFDKIRQNISDAHAAGDDLAGMLDIDFAF